MLLELGKMPEKFALLGPGCDTERVSVSAAIYQSVIAADPTYYGDGYTSMMWATKLVTPHIITYFVSNEEMDSDTRLVDISLVRTFQDDELNTIGEGRRDLLEMKFTDNPNITDQGIGHFTKCVVQLNTLIIDRCIALTDEAMREISRHLKNLKHLSVESCNRITDDGVISVVTACPELQRLNLSHCEFMTDDGLLAIAEKSRKLESLKMGFCFHLTNNGFYSFSLRVNAATLKELDFSACRRLEDTGLHNISTRCTKLVSLNLYYCNKITDEGAKAVTHNLWDLEDLNLQDLYKVTDASFTYDQEFDGRIVVNKVMLKKIKKMSLADCKEVTDRGLAEIAHRCTDLVSLNLKGCVNISNEGVRLMINDHITEQRIGEHLKELNFTFCHRLTDAALQTIASNMPGLEGIDLTGCVLVTDVGVQVIANSFVMLVAMVCGCKKFFVLNPF